MQYIANKLLSVNLEQGIHIGSKKDYTELSLVSHEAGKKQAHIPLREYLSRSLNTVMSLKSCFSVIRKRFLSIYHALEIYLIY